MRAYVSFGVHSKTRLVRVRAHLHATVCTTRQTRTDVTRGGSVTHLRHRSHAQLVLIDAEGGKANPNERENEQDRQEYLDACRNLHWSRTSDGTAQKSRAGEMRGAKSCERNHHGQDRMPYAATSTHGLISRIVCLQFGKFNLQIPRPQTTVREGFARPIVAALKDSNV